MNRKIGEIKSLKRLLIRSGFLFFLFGFNIISLPSCGSKKQSMDGRNRASKLYLKNNHPVGVVQQGYKAAFH